jgi:hypothetical protein
MLRVSISVIDFEIIEESECFTSSSPKQEFLQSVFFADFNSTSNVTNINVIVIY